MAAAKMWAEGQGEILGLKETDKVIQSVSFFLGNFKPSQDQDLEQ